MLGPEQALWHGDDRLIFSRNVQDSVAFDYSKGNEIATRRTVLTQTFKMYTRASMPFSKGTLPVATQ